MGGLPRAPLALAAAAWLVAGGFTAAAGASSGPAASSAWTVYHGNAAGTGVAGPVPGADLRAPAWTSPALDGDIYGEPLVFAGRVYVATENNTVYALSATTGSVAWSTHLGTPCPRVRCRAATSRPPSGSRARRSSTHPAARSSWWPTNW